MFHRKGCGGNMPEDAFPEKGFTGVRRQQVQLSPA